MEEKVLAILRRSLLFAKAHRISSMNLAVASRNLSLSSARYKNCSSQIFVSPRFPHADHAPRWSRLERWFSSETSLKPEENDSFPEVKLSDSCISRLKKLQSEEPEVPVYLRVAVEGGGCSGFQYTFSLDHKVNPDDIIFERDGGKVVVDDTSLEYLKGSTVDWSEELIRSAFRVISNPKADHGCSCGSSFSVKI